jgi:diketogulonate reductase-like aldo/keto reductase
MEALNREGLAKAIGVANFYPDRLIDLIVNNDITPAVNQIGTRPFFQRTADQMAAIATLDTGSSLFFDHRDRAMVD